MYLVKSTSNNMYISTDQQYCNTHKSNEIFAMTVIDTNQQMMKLFTGMTGINQK